MKAALEMKWKVAMPDENAIIAWMVECAAMLLNRLQVGSDGSTSYERSTGQRAAMVGLEFAEGVWFKEKAEPQHRQYGGQVGARSVLRSSRPER